MAGKQSAANLSGRVAGPRQAFKLDELSLLPLGAANVLKFVIHCGLPSRTIPQLKNIAYVCAPYCIDQKMFNRLCRT
jgi:hypothetical protein